MKIAFIINTFPKLSETFILNQITGLMDLGHQVTIFSMGYSGEKKLHPDVEKYKLLKKVVYLNIPEVWHSRAISGIKIAAMSLPKSPLKVLNSVNTFRFGRSAASLNILHLLPSFLKNRFDIIHAHFGPNGILSSYLKRLGVTGKYMTTFYGYDINSYPLQPGARNYGHLFSHGDLFAANTEYSKARTVELGCPASKTIVLPVGLKIGLFEFRPRVYRKGETLKVLTVARLVEKKGHEYAIKAMSELASRGLKIEYLIAGTGPERGRLDSLISGLGVSGLVKFMGDVDEDEYINALYSSHIFLLPSVTASNFDREGQALVLQEAQATGMPVISTYHNGIPEGVLDGRSGFLVPEKDHLALADKISLLAKNPESWAEIGKAGRIFVEGKYDIKILNKKLEGLYLGLLESSPLKTSIKTKKTLPSSA